MLHFVWKATTVKVWEDLWGRNGMPCILARQHSILANKGLYEPDTAPTFSHLLNLRQVTAHPKALLSFLGYKMGLFYMLTKAEGSYLVLRCFHFQELKENSWF